MFKFKNMFKEKKNTTTKDSDAGTLLHKKLSFAATEAYKLLRTNLKFTLADVEGCRIVGVTSSIRGEGKSTTAVNLSYTLAEMGKRVLLIDGDLRLPSIAKKLEIKATPGLSNLLAEDDMNTDAITHSPLLDNWHILPAGDIPPNPTEMLGSAQMEKLMAKLSQEYDYIVIDLPPVNIVSDALVISNQLSGMIVVVRENYSQRRDINSCMKQLELSDVRVLGYVMNVKGQENKLYARYGKYGKHSKRYSGYEKSKPSAEGFDK
jgi:capsular exopolysaccharide synthesis family protein